MEIEEEPRVAEYAALLARQAAAAARCAALRHRDRSRKHALPFLQPGRLARVLTPALEAGAAGGGEGGAEDEQAVHGTAERVRPLS